MSSSKRRVSGRSHHRSPTTDTDRGTRTPKLETSVVPDPPPSPSPGNPSQRGRGRGRRRGGKVGKSHGPPGAKIRTLSFPVTDRDEEVVECSPCRVRMAYRDFRLHNLETHYNIAMTTDDKTLEDRRFYENKLRELTKIKKISTYICPRCSTSYKSCLGLAFHLEACGRTPEEIASVKVICDVCNEKFFSQNLSWHKRSHAQPEPDDESGSDHSNSREIQSKQKRKSAIMAREFIRSETNTQPGDNTADDDDSVNLTKVKSDTGIADEDWFSSLDESRKGSRRQDSDDEEGFDSDCEDGDWYRQISSLSRRKSNVEKRSKTTPLKQLPLPVPKYNDDELLSMESIPLRGSSRDIWDSPVRNYVDPLLQLGLLEASHENRTTGFTSDIEIRLHLPSLENSPEFRTKTLLSAAPNNQVFTTTLNHTLSRFDSEVVDSIDSNFIAFIGGAILSMAWHPSGNLLAISAMQNDEEDPNLLEARTRRSSILIYCRPSTDGSPDTNLSLELIIALNYGYVNHMQWCNYWPTCVDHFSNGSAEPGEDSEENTKIGYLACAMEDSTIRCFSLNIFDFQLPFNFFQNQKSFRVYQKDPEICLAINPNSRQTPGHCTTFDWHEGHNYLAAGYGSGLIAVFDLGTTSTLLKSSISHGTEGEAHVVTLYPFWVIKGHVLPVKSIVTNPTNSRYFHSGSMDRFVKTWDIEFKKEIESKHVGAILDMNWIRGWMHLAISTDMGVGYGNANTQNNFVRFCQVGSSKGTPNVPEHYNVTSISFFEGMTAQATEAGKVNVTFYDAFWRECDFERNKRKTNSVVLSQLDVDPDSFDPLPSVSEDDYDLNKDIFSLALNSEKPRLILTFSKNRNDPSQLQTEPTAQQVENCIRFYSSLKINKITWCPTGTELAVGYRNGLFAIVPASFDRLFKYTPGKRGPKSKH